MTLSDPCHLSATPSSRSRFGRSSPAKRGDSHDGRSFGLVSREAILGRAMGVFWRGGPAWDGL